MEDISAIEIFGKEKNKKKPFLLKKAAFLLLFSGVKFYKKLIMHSLA